MSKVAERSVGMKVFRKKNRTDQKWKCSYE